MLPISFCSRRFFAFAALVLSCSSVSRLHAQTSPATPSTSTPTATPSAAATPPVTSPTPPSTTPDATADSSQAASSTGSASGATGTGATTGVSDAGGATGGVAPTAAPTPAPPVLPARGTLEISGDAREMSVFAVSSDAQELFTALADRAKMPLLVDDTVSRRLTVNIVDRTPRQIIEDIARAYGLSAADVNGVTMISEGIPRSPSSYLLSDIDSIRTKYVDAANARNLLPVFLQDYVKVNSEQNAVVLSAPREVLNKFRQDIAQFDIPASQILLDLLLIELTDTNADELGLSLSYANAGRGISLLPGVGSSSFSAITTLKSGFFFELRALQQQGKARVRANPRIATVSGRPASIFVGRQQYVLTPLDNGTNNISAGVRLNVTPYTGGEKQVLIDATAEVSTLSAPDPTTRLPEKSTRTANTSVRINDGQTIVIGGLKQQESRNIRTRVPLLGSLPLLGRLFQTKSVRTTNTELVLFITPHILSDTGHLPADQEKILKERFLDSDLNTPLPPAPASTFDLPSSTRSPLSPDGVMPGTTTPNMTTPNTTTPNATTSNMTAPSATTSGAANGAAQ